MIFDSVNKDLSELLQSTNGCQYTDIEDNHIDNTSLQDGTRINILHLNIRSYHKNIDSLVVLLKDLQERGIVVHVIVLCETFLSSVNCVAVDLENYQGIHRYRNECLGGSKHFCT